MLIQRAGGSQVKPRHGCPKPGTLGVVSVMLPKSPREIDEDEPSCKASMEDDDPGAEIELSGAQLEMSDESPGTVWLMLSHLQLTVGHMKRGTAHGGGKRPSGTGYT